MRILLVLLLFGVPWRVMADEEFANRCFNAALGEFVECGAAAQFRCERVFLPLEQKPEELRVRGPDDKPEVICCEYVRHGIKEPAGCWSAP